MISMRGTAALAAAVLGLALAGDARAEGAPPGATSCSGCHGREPQASVGPPLRGRATAEIVAAMEAFRSGARPATVMDRIAKGFDVKETEAIAQWWAKP